MRSLTALKLLWRGLIRNDEYARYQLAERVARALYPRYAFSEFGRTFLDDDEFRRLYESVEGSSNLRSLDRKYVVDQLAQLACDVPGDSAECGVLRGVSSLLICRRLLTGARRHHVFDSFEGLSAPDASDGAYWKAGDLAVDEDTVRRNLADFEGVVFHKGWIPERFHEVADEKFAFVHIDVDLYQPTRDALAFFYERLSPGGIVLLDDYGFRSCPGARRAIDELMQDRKEPIVQLPTGQAFVLRDRAEGTRSDQATRGAR